MKPSPERLDLSSYPAHNEIPARFSDVDMFRHLNNVAIGQFYEEVRFALTAEMRERVPRERRSAILVVNVDTAYLREARYPGLITVGTGFVQRSRSAYVMGQALFQEGKCFSACDTTLVYTENGQPAEMPESFDETFQRLRLPSFADQR